MRRRQPRRFVYFYYLICPSLTIFFLSLRLSLASHVFSPSSFSSARVHFCPPCASFLFYPHVTFSSSSSPVAWSPFLHHQCQLQSAQPSEAQHQRHLGSETEVGVQAFFDVRNQQSSQSSAAPSCRSSFNQAQFEGSSTLLWYSIGFADVGFLLQENPPCA